MTFDVEQKPSGVLLSWQTAVEYNSDKFILQRSEDAVNFSTIREIPANGNSGSIKHYRVIDPVSHTGNLYYKLVLRDKNGTLKELGIKYLKGNSSIIHAKVYPNPTHGRTQVIFASDKFQMMRIRTITGSIILQEEIQANEQKKIINLGKYPAGVYLLELKGKTGQTNLKIIKK